MDAHKDLEAHQRVLLSLIFMRICWVEKWQIILTNSLQMMRHFSFLFDCSIWSSIVVCCQGFHVSERLSTTQQANTVACILKYFMWMPFLAFQRSSNKRQTRLYAKYVSMLHFNMRHITDHHHSPLYGWYSCRRYSCMSLPTLITMTGSINIEFFWSMPYQQKEQQTWGVRARYGKQDTLLRETTRPTIQGKASTLVL